MDVRLHPLEYAQRELPGVCAVTGRPADWYLRVHVRRPLNPAWFLLVLVGPLGWLVLLAASIHNDGTHVDVPVSEQVHGAMLERRRRARWMAAAVVPQIALFSLMTMPGALLAFLPEIVLAIWVSQIPNHRIRLRIDSVGLVTIRRPHPQFAAAVDMWRTRHLTATPQP